jgi:single-strand DNA-binding protein
MSVSSYSHTLIVGRVARDPHMSVTSKGNAMASFDVVVTRRTTTRGEAQETVTFVPVISYSKTADVVGQFFKKGDLVLVAGRLEAAKDGTKNLLLVGEVVQVLSVK